MKNIKQVSTKTPSGHPRYDFVDNSGTVQARVLPLASGGYLGSACPDDSGEFTVKRMRFESPDEVKEFLKERLK